MNNEYAYCVELAWDANYNDDETFEDYVFPNIREAIAFGVNVSYNDDLYNEVGKPNNACLYRVRMKKFGTSSGWYLNDDDHEVLCYWDNLNKHVRDHELIEG